MFKHLRALFKTRHTLPAHVHFHLDEAGHEVLCDETACRPTHDSPLLAGLTGHSIR